MQGHGTSDNEEERVAPYLFRSMSMNTMPEAPSSTSSRLQALCRSPETAAVMTTSRKRILLPYFSSHAGPTTRSSCALPARCAVLTCPNT